MKNTIPQKIPVLFSRPKKIPFGQNVRPKKILRTPPSLKYVSGALGRALSDTIHPRRPRGSRVGRKGATKRMDAISIFSKQICSLTQRFTLILERGRKEEEKGFNRKEGGSQ